MKTDKISNFKDYISTNKNFFLVIDFLNKNLDELSLGRYELGNDCYVNLVEYEPTENDIFEAHKRYIDVHFAIKGNECIKHQSIDKLTITQDYVEGDDCFLGKVEKSKILDLEENNFAIFYPQDAHCPANFKTAKKIKKAIFKITI